MPPAEYPDWAEAVVRRELRRLPRWVVRHAGEDDLLQEARLAVLAAVRGYRPGKLSVEDYARWCAERRMKAVSRTVRLVARGYRGWRPRMTGVTLSFDVAARPEPEPPEPLVYPDTARAALSWPQRLFLTLIAREGMTVTEIAAAFGIAHQAVSIRMKRVQDKFTEFGVRP